MSDAAADPHGDVVVNVFGRTDVGRTREHNEDAFVVVDLSTDNATLQPEVRRHTLGSKGTLFMVADGMGGAAAGEIASAMAVEVVLGEMREKWIAADTHDPEQFVRAIKRATAAANQQIHAFAASHTEYRGMGTTATVAGLLGDMLYVAQVGDSRAYLVRDGVARQITKDQSLMQKLIAAGGLPETGQTSAVTAEIPPATDGPPRRTSKPTLMPSIEPPEVVEPQAAGSSLGSSLGSPAPELADDFSTAPTPVTGTPAVSPTRRQTGRVIAIALLVALVAT